MTLVQKAEKFVFYLFRDKVSDAHIYHNFQHTSRVFLAVKILVENLQVSDNDAEILYLTSWFHDTGYSVSEQNHEQKSAEIARDFLVNENFPEEKIKKVERLIQGTCMAHNPTDLLEEIIKDADTSHFADANYLGICELLRAEWEITLNKTFSDLEWNTLNRDMLLNKHRYYTDYAKENWQRQKEENITGIQKRIVKFSIPKNF